MSPKVLVYTISRANTPGRAKLLNDTLTLGRNTADYPFHWHVYVNGTGTLAAHIADAAFSIKVIDSYSVSEANVGQHVWVNAAHQKALEEGYDYVVRTDDDVEWNSKRWLAKLVEASITLRDAFVLSPVVKGLRWQPSQSNQIDIEGIPLKIIEGPIGGICRLTPTALLKVKPYVSDVRLPMGGGDAAGIGRWAMHGDPLVYLAYCQHIRIRHAKSTDGQEAADPLHFKEHDLFQHLPYIPAEW